jgi:DNA-binding transcriptional LysR family regulator
MDRPDSGDIRFKKLTSFAYGLYGASSYFGDRPRPLRVSDLSGDTWCGSIRELLHTSELDLGAIDDATLKPRFRTTSVTAQLATVLSGSAIAVLPCFVAADHPQLERLLAAQVSPLRNYWIAVHDDLAQSPRVRFVMDGIGKVVAQDRGRFLAKEPDRAAAEMSAEEQEAAVIGSIARLITIPHREIEVQRGV